MAATKEWYFRHPKTAQEKRKYYDHPELVRGKRTPRNLPDSYDDYWVKKQRNWKSKRKTQYRDKTGYEWHEIKISLFGTFDYREILVERFERLGYEYDIQWWTVGCYDDWCVIIKWFGKDCR